MIALVDYGIGNLRSVEKALATVGAEVLLTSDPQVIASARQVVLPGVGAFGDGMAGLRQRGLETVIREIALRGTPLLGICLGMQLLFESSEEMGEHAGLGLLPGRVHTLPGDRLEGAADRLEPAHTPAGDSPACWLEQRRLCLFQPQLLL